MATVLPEGLEERFRKLRRSPKLRRDLKAEREAAVHGQTYGTDRDLFVPPVPLDPGRNQPTPHLVDAPGEYDFLAGMDKAGRPVLVRTAHVEGVAAEKGVLARPVVAHPEEDNDRWVLHVRLLTWSAERLEIVGFLTSDSVSHVTWVDFDAQGRPERFATRGIPQNDIGKGASVTWCAWDGTQCRETCTMSTHDDRQWVGQRCVGKHDGRGLAQILRATTHPITDDPSARDALADLHPLTVFWDRRIDGPEDDPLSRADALERWIRSLADAAWRVVAETDPRHALFVRVARAFTSDERPGLVVGTAAQMAAVRGRVPPEEAVDRHHADRVDLLTHVDDEGLRARRSLLQDPEFRERDATYAEPLLRELDRRQWPDGALPLVNPGAYDDRWAWLRRVLGAARVDALLAAVGPEAAVLLPTRAPSSRDELAAALRAASVPEHVAQQARWGLALVGDGHGRSRLGGLPELPDGMPWPVSEGRVLTHLASIDLAEVPDVEHRDLLPRDGTLVFFADLSEDGELYGPVVVGDDDRVRLLLVAPGTPTYRPLATRDDRSGYDAPLLLRSRKVRFEPVLVPPQDPEGLDDGQRLSYERLFDALLALQPETAQHLLLGRMASGQLDPTSGDGVPLLQMGWDEELGFEFLDRGTISLIGGEGDLRAGRWDRLVVHTDSC